MTTDFDHLYMDMVSRVTSRPIERNQRTGERVRQAPGLGFSDVGGLPLVTLRDINVKWPAAEAVWFLSGSNDPGFMRSFGFKAWDDFAERDGRVWSATGWRWRSAFVVDQVAQLVANLKDDPTTRQGVLQTWSAVEDLDPETRPKNVPCLTTWHFCVVGDALHMSVFQRSADLWYGLPHDVAGAAIIQFLLARELELEPGLVSWLIGNAHLYANSEAAVRELEDLYDTAPAGRTPNLRLALPPQVTLEACMAGEEWTVWEIYHAIERVYKRMKGPKIKGGKLVV